MEKPVSTITTIALVVAILWVPPLFAAPPDPRVQLEQALKSDDLATLLTIVNSASQTEREEIVELLVSRYTSRQENPSLLHLLDQVTLKRPFSLQNYTLTHYFTVATKARNRSQIRHLFAACRYVPLTIKQELLIEHHKDAIAKGISISKLTAKNYQKQAEAIIELSQKLGELLYQITLDHLAGSVDLTPEIYLQTYVNPQRGFKRFDKRTQTLLGSEKKRYRQAVEHILLHPKKLISPLLLDAFDDLRNEGLEAARIFMIFTEFLDGQLFKRSEILSSLLRRYATSSVMMARDESDNDIIEGISNLAAANYYRKYFTTAISIPMFNPADLKHGTKVLQDRFNALIHEQGKGIMTEKVLQSFLRETRGYVQAYFMHCGDLLKYHIDNEKYISQAFNNEGVIPRKIRKGRSTSQTHKVSQDSYNAGRLNRIVLDCYAYAHLYGALLREIRGPDGLFFFRDFRVIKIDIIKKDRFGFGDVIDKYHSIGIATAHLSLRQTVVIGFSNDVIAQYDVLDPEDPENLAHFFNTHNQTFNLKGALTTTIDMSLPKKRLEEM